MSLIMVTGCGNNMSDGSSYEEVVSVDSVSHGKNAEPNYDLLFDDSTVHRIDITIQPDNFALMEADMTSTYGAFGNVGNNLPPEGAPPEGPPEEGALLPEGPPPGQFPPALAMINEESSTNPIYVPVTVSFNNVQWFNVGMRYKGNSSLRAAWTQGIHKLPFRLNFDHYEDEVPSITDQRFWGFKKMTFSSGYKDHSAIRDKLAYDVYRNAGMISPRAAFYEIYIDTGSGPVYWGLYAMVEDPSDDMLKEQFGSNSGNLYKPEATTTIWTNFDQESFVKKTNEDASDWSDVIAATQYLAANNLDGLSTVFVIEDFLKYYAINNTIMNWDVYGVMNHNYYIYADPACNNKLRWFPWDLNESFTNDNKCLSFSMDEITNSAPLIRYIMDDNNYKDYYHSQLQEVVDGALNANTVSTLIQTYADLVEQSVINETTGYTYLSADSDFATEISKLKILIQNRNSAVTSYLGGL